MDTSRKGKGRHHLYLEQKVKVINKCTAGSSVKALSEEFCCSTTQIYCILKNKKSIMELYEANASGSLHRTNKRSRLSEYSEINDALYKHIYRDGSHLKEKAREIAERLGNSSFNGRNGWFEKWKKRHNIRKVTVCGESGDVKGYTVDSWKERLPEILKGYQKEDIYNLDETVASGGLSLIKVLARKVKSVKVGKNRNTE